MQQMESVQRASIKKEGSNRISIFSAAPNVPLCVCVYVRARTCVGLHVCMCAIVRTLFMPEEENSWPVSSCKKNENFTDCSSLNTDIGDF